MDSQASPQRQVLDTLGHLARQARQLAGQGQGPSAITTIALFALALLALELVNAATTFWALDNLMGSAGVLGASFALVLTVALAALDTGGLIKMFGPGADRLQGSNGLYFVMAAWLLSAATNAILTWWAVSSAMAAHVAGNAVLSQAQLLDVTPPFLAVALWLMRLLLVAGWAQGELVDGHVGRAGGRERTFARKQSELGAGDGARVQ